LEPDYYDILGVAPTATNDEIKAAYRERARTMHPDKHQGDPRAEERFELINAAGGILKNPDKRAEYDKRRRATEVPPQPPKPEKPRATRHTQAPEHSDTSFWPGENSPMDDLFRGLVGKRPGSSRSSTGTGQAPAGKTNEPLSKPIPFAVTVEEAYGGAQRSYMVDQQGGCPDCHGAGVTNKGQTGFTVGPATCPTCRGKGTISRSEAVPVTVAPGVREGSLLRVRGKGVLQRDGKRGDLLFEVHLTPHNRFQIEGGDILVEVEVPYPVLVLGGDAEAPLPIGRTRLTVLPGTRHGSVLTIPGKGLPALGSHPAGQLRVQLGVEIPKRISEEERRLLEALSRFRERASATR